MMTEEENNNAWANIKLPHILYLVWPVESMLVFAENPVPQDKTKMFFQYIGEENKYLDVGRIYEFHYAAYSPGEGTPRRKVLVTSDGNMPLDERIYPSQTTTTIRLEEIPKEDWNPVCIQTRKSCGMNCIGSCSRTGLDEY